MCWNRWLQRVASPLLAGVFLWLVALAALMPGATVGAPVPEQGIQTQEKGLHRTSHDSAVPQKARDLLNTLQDRQGVPLPGYVGGRDFKNRERHLPRGKYREYDVNPKIRGQSRDAERLVIEQQTGKAYYTGDHYRTFIPLN